MCDLVVQAGWCGPLLLFLPNRLLYTLNGLSTRAFLRELPQRIAPNLLQEVERRRGGFGFPKP